VSTNSGRPEPSLVEPKPGVRGAREQKVRPHRGSVPLRKLIPNLVTGASLCAGIASLHYAAQGQFEKAIAAIIIAFVLDGFDGRLARLLKVTSRFGETFDSIADFTAFGMAPAFLIYQWARRGTLEPAMETLASAVVIMYGICAAYRLARFTVQARRRKIGAPVSPFFQGMPAPAAGGIVLILPMLELSTIGLASPAWLVLAFAALISLLMVSRLPMISVKGVRVSRRLILPILVLLGLLAMGMVRDFWLTASIFFGLYFLSFPVALLLHHRGIIGGRSPSSGVGAESAPRSPRL
jgi:CDP-diacylglycerol--serine O-phosphatidyltransferase